MRDITDIKLDQVIVHILNPGQSDGLVLSQTAIPSIGNESIIDYFIAHIQNSIKDTKTSAARFLNLDTKATSGICKALLEGRLDLVKGSQMLAQKLYDIIRKDQRISAGDLAVCFYQAGKESNRTRYLALLKIDPSEVFRHKTQRDSQGKLYVSFEIETNVLHTTREKLQKCAFIQPFEPRSEYDLMLLDRQGRQPLPQPVATFFIKDFLGAEQALDSRQRTDRLYRGLISASNQLRKDLKPNEKESLNQAIEDAVSSVRINLDSWIDALPLPNEYKERINQEVSKDLPDREFEIDTTFAEQLSRIRRFRGKNGDLKVDVSAEKYKQIIVSEKRVDEPGSPPYYCIEIHTEIWDEVTR